MITNKLLYVDVPFQNLHGGDKNRSKLLWNIFCEAFQSDLLLLLTEHYRTRIVPEHNGFVKEFRLATQQPHFFEPAAIYQFNQVNIKIFEEILIAQQYDIVVFRFLSPFHLASVVKKVLPNCFVAFDVDMLFSRISEMSWQERKSLRNRYHLFEMMKLKNFEKRAFRNPYLFFFTNYLERDMAVNEYSMESRKTFIIPNMMPDEPKAEESTQQPLQERYILFFGSLDSMANKDAYSYLEKDIYPRLEKILTATNTYIHISGKSPEQLKIDSQKKMIKVVGPVDDMQKEIAGSMFVVLPLRIASGTRTRILEAAAVGKAVVTTTIGAEGFRFSEEGLAIYDEAAGFAKCVSQFIQQPDIPKNMGNVLHKEATQTFTQDAVARDLVNILDSPGTSDVLPKTRKSIKLAIITNRFYPEVGGAETNIYYQARLLAKLYDLTVICPQRGNRPKYEYLDGFRVLRLKDLLNREPDKQNIQAKTLCPELFWHLLIEKYDIVQCFPALNYNNMLAFAAAKLKKIPYILCFFDFVDYASLATSKGGIDPDVLKTIEPKWYQKIILRGMSYAFAIANKEIEFIKRFNDKIEYSPVPILAEEYSAPVPDPSTRFGFLKQDFVFLSLGRISHIKGQDIALKAFCQALPEMPDAKLVFVGRSDYDLELLASMQSFIDNNSLQTKVFFTGMVERVEVLGWLRRADIHVIPVRFMNSGAVVVESWISDTPVLQSDVVDPNLVVAGDNGYLFKREDVDDCARNMVLAYNNRENLSSMAARGKELVMTRYTYDYLIGLYSKTYNRLLHRN